MLNHRSTDAVITVCQNNEKHRVDIHEINRAVEETLGFAAHEMIEHELAEFLPARIQDLIREYVEFEEDANDVGSVLSKVQNFVVLDKTGKEVSFRLKVVRSEALDGQAHFRLVLQDKIGIRKIESFKRVLMDNFQGHETMDPATGLPDRGSIAKHLELCLYFINKGELRATFAIIEIDNYAEMVKTHGEACCGALHQHIALLAKKSLRLGDTLGTLAPNRLGLILIDAPLEPARMVLNRFRWIVSATPVALADQPNISFTVSIGFAQIGGRVNDSKLMGDCEIFLNARGGQTNMLVQVGEVEKRGTREDRRKSDMPVAMERRQGDRRGNEPEASS